MKSIINSLLKNRTFENLVDTAKQGDSKAIYELMNMTMTEKMFNGIASKNGYINKLDKHQIKTAYSDAYLDVIESISKIDFKDIERLKAYAYGIAKNKLYDSSKNQERKTKKIISLDKIVALGQSFYEPEEIEKSIDNNDMRLLIHQCCAALNFDDTMMIQLKIDLGFEYSEISNLLKIELAACRKRYQRAIEKVKTCLNLKK